MGERRLLFAAPSSGSGKTLITCGLMHLFRRRGLCVQPFKCGPDFIDPMFHAYITGRPSGNLDAFLSDHATLCRLLAEGAKTADLTMIEGVMGCFDGISFGDSAGSSCAIAKEMGTPVILIVNARGMSTTLVPMLAGLLNWPGGEMIRGVLLNRVSEGTYPALKQMIETQLPVTVAGYLPELPGVHLDSRHLGLQMPHEIEGLDRQLDLLADTLERTVPADTLLALAETAAPLPRTGHAVPGVSHTDASNTGAPAADTSNNDLQHTGTQHTDTLQTGIQYIDAQNGGRLHTDRLRIGVAQDEAFCFFYTENLRMLESAGAELVRFSPLRDTALPPALDALLLCGGYPELRARELSQNTGMREAVRKAACGGMPVLAECGGFLYLHETLEDPQGTAWPMCGVIPARAYHNRRLTRFGYITLDGGRLFGQAIGPIPAHEFHHYESTDPGRAFRAVKPDGRRQWDCIHSTDTLYAGFPHLFYPANPAIVSCFLQAAARNRDDIDKGETT